jgi:hypothetical protein
LDGAGSKPSGRPKSETTSTGTPMEVLNEDLFEGLNGAQFGLEEM